MLLELAVAIVTNNRKTNNTRNKTSSSLYFFQTNSARIQPRLIRRSHNVNHAQRVNCFLVKVAERLIKMKYDVIKV